MDLKDKLNLLWKYLLLVVIVFGLAMHLREPRFNRIRSAHHSTSDYSASGCYMDDPHLGMGHGSMIKVEKQVINGDTTLVIWVDGEKIDNPEEYLKEHKAGFKSKGGRTMRWKESHGKKGKKEIHIEMRTDSD